MELAVYIPEQEPQVGQGVFCVIRHPGLVQLSGVIRPHRLKHSGSGRCGGHPGGGPPAWGRRSRRWWGYSAAPRAISRPGTFLSQLGSSPRPSNWWAMTMASVESAMRFPGHQRILSYPHGPWRCRRTRRWPETSPAYRLRPGYRPLQPRRSCPAPCGRGRSRL